MGDTSHAMGARQVESSTRSLVGESKPVVVALVTDHVVRDEGRLGLSLLVTTVPVALLGLALNLFGLRAFDKVRAELSDDLGTTHL